MSANIKASTDGTQAIIGVGGVDQMTVSNAGVVTANSFVGAISNTSVTATGSTTARTLANRFADVVNVKDFGAVGDGVTDDTAAIQAAVNVGLSRPFGYTIYFPSGRYITRGHDFTSKTKVIGDGTFATVLVLKNNTNTRFISFVNSERSSIEDICLDGNKANQTSTSNALIFFQGRENIARNVKVVNAYSIGIGVNNCVKCKIESCDVNNSGGPGLWAQGVSDGTIFSNCRSVLSGQDNIIVNSNYITVTNSYFDNNINPNYAGIFVAYELYGAIITNNTVVNSTNPGIDIGWGTTSESHLHIVSNNICVKNLGGGITCAANGTIITNNQCIDNGNHPTWNYASGIAIDGKKMIISNNKCSNSTTSFQKYGLFVRNLSGNTENNRIQSNDFSNNSVAVLYDPLITYQYYSYNTPAILSAFSNTGGFSLNAGVSAILGSFLINGAVFSDSPILKCPYSLQGITAIPYVDLVNNCKVALYNNTSTTKTFGAGTFTIEINR